MDHADAIDETMLLQALKNTNSYLLKEFEEDDTVRDPLADALEMAESIGVTIKLGGLLPEDKDVRSLLAAAIRECATNTRKHADGDLLLVDTAETDEGFELKLSGNGRVEAGPVKETGGLKSLRTLAENTGGSMEALADKEFTLRIFVPKKSKE